MTGTHLQQEKAQPIEGSQQMRSMMLDDLPSDSAEFLNKIKYVQTHDNRAVVSMETQTNSWFIQLENVNGNWRVSGF